MAFKYLQPITDGCWELVSVEMWKVTQSSPRPRPVIGKSCIRLKQPWRFTMVFWWCRADWYWLKEDLGYPCQFSQHIKEFGSLWKVVKVFLWVYWILSRTEQSWGKNHGCVTETETFLYFYNILTFHALYFQQTWLTLIIFHLPT